ncbi:MAG: hypothetical protein HDS14_08380 [Bacteroides sp.]|nr:hypothetical protein [Bacteroides sp.]
MIKRYNSRLLIPEGMKLLGARTDAVIKVIVVIAIIIGCLLLLDEAPNLSIGRFIAQKSAALLILITSRRIWVSKRFGL